MPRHSCNPKGAWVLWAISVLLVVNNVHRDRAPVSWFSADPEFAGAGQ
jgi:hypothetical protein